MHDAQATATFRVGVAGWDYADWVGPVYPPASRGRFDRLAYLGRYVDVVEVNSTFYRPVASRVAESWLRRMEDRPGFRFTAKAHRSWTHEPGSSAATVVPPTLHGLRPLHDAGRLGALLVQFPQSFHLGPAAWDRIDRLLEHTEDWPVVVEVRHVSWESDEAAEGFADRSVGWCSVDQPRAGGSTSKPIPRVVGPVGYLRLHGRNERDWFRKDAGRDARYDYLYPARELEQLAGQARSMAATAEELFVIQNNHFRGQALVNALQMKKLLQKRTPRAPEELVAAYPALETDVDVERHRLF